VSDEDLCTKLLDDSPDEQDSEIYTRELGEVPPKDSGAGRKVRLPIVASPSALKEAVDKIFPSERVGVSSIEISRAGTIRRTPGGDIEAFVIPEDSGKGMWKMLDEIQKIEPDLIFQLRDGLERASREKE
jgi:hypothetical protein